MTDAFSTDCDLFNPPFLHCYPSTAFEVGVMDKICSQKGFGFYEVDLKGSSSREMMFDMFAVRMRFPSCFGRNWSALINALTTLSWDKRLGYVAVIENADALLDYSDDTLMILIEVCKVISSHRQDKENKHRKPIYPVPFHFFFVGLDEFCRLVSPLMDKPVHR